MRDEKTKKKCVGLLQNCSSATHRKVMFGIPAGVAIGVRSSAIVDIVGDRGIS